MYDRIISNSYYDSYSVTVLFLLLFDVMVSIHFCPTYHEDVSTNVHDGMTNYGLLNATYLCNHDTDKKFSLLQ